MSHSYTKHQERNDKIPKQFSRIEEIAVTLK